MQRTALCLARMSTNDSKEQLQRQDDDIRAICRLADYNIEPDLFWLDEDESANRDTRYRQGKSVDPPGLMAVHNALVSMTSEGRAVAVVGWKADRLFRDVEAKESYFRLWARINERSEGDVPLVVVHTGDGFWNPGLASDRLTSTVITASNQHYADVVREKVVRAHRERRENGQVATGFGGFGYNPKPVRKKSLGKTPQRQGEIENERPSGGVWTINEAEAALIRRAATELLDGRAGLQIIREWQEAGVPTTLGGKWTPTTFRRVMTKPAIAGIVVSQGKEVGKGAWEPIIDETTFRRLQALFDRPHSRPRLTKGLLTGVLYCGHCDGYVRLHQNIKGTSPEKRVYGCNQCGKSNIDAHAVESVYVDRLWERLDNPHFREAMTNDNEAQVILAAIGAQEADKEHLKASADRIPVDVYVAKAESIEVKLDRLRREWDQMRRPALVWIHDLDRLKAAWPNMDKGRQRALLLDVVGPSKVSSAGTSGKRVTPQRIQAQLTRIRPAS
jgi:DNA invertase Pin-like site-specific DNA recombinase